MEQANIYLSKPWIIFIFTLLIHSLSTFAQEPSDITIYGVLEAYVIDKHDGSHKTIFYLREDKTQRRYELLNLKEGRTDSRLVQISGKRLNAKQIQVTEVAFDGSSATNTSTISGLPNSSGPQRTLVYLVNFQDKPTEKPWTLAQAQDLVFNQINAFYQENSSGRTSIVGTVIGWYTLPIDSTTCDGFSIQNHAQRIAGENNIAVNNYDRHVFIFPSSACGYSGMGQVGVVPSSTWINNSFNIRTIAHELGHNLGLNHSSALDCPGTPLASTTDTCTRQEYGNTLDTMGYTSTTAHFNAYQKDRLGWLDSIDLAEITASGTYNIAPYEFSSSQNRVLKIYRGIDSTTGLKQWFYLEYRQPLGFDSLLIDRGVIDPVNAFGGVAIVLGTEGNGKSLLLDMTPDSAFVDLKDPALLPGKIFSDPVSGVSIEALSANSSSVSVKITLGSSTPPPTADTTSPSVNFVSPSNGAIVSGILSIIANASDNVGISRVELHVDGVLRQSDSNSPYSFILDTTSLSNGTHTLALKAFDAAGNVGSSQISVNVNNSTLDTTAPSVLITSPQNATVFSPRTSITIQANASDNVLVNRVEFYVNGALICSDSSASYSCTYKLPGAKGATYLIEARAFDSSNNSASHQISISSSAGGGRK